MALGKTINGQSVEAIRNYDTVAKEMSQTGSGYGLSPTKAAQKGWTLEPVPDSQSVTGSPKLVENINTNWLDLPKSQPVTPAQIPQQQQSEQPQ